MEVRARGRMRTIAHAIERGVDAAWRAVTLAAAILFVGAGALTGTGLFLGAGPIVDALVLGAVTALSMGILWLVLRAAGTLVRRLGRRMPGLTGRVPAAVSRPHPTATLAAAVIAYLVLASQVKELRSLAPSAVFLPEIGVGLIAAALVGLGRAAWTGPGRGDRQPGRLARASGIGAFAIAGVLVAGTLGWAAWPGPGSMRTPPMHTAATQIDLPDPGAPGPYKVLSTAYGSGLDPRRPEFGSAAPIRTTTVDASLQVDDFPSPAGDFVRWYLGGGMEAIGLNALVWYPDGAGPFPLVLVVHGNHAMGDYSEPGYAYLGEHLASRGFIVASVDEAVLNGFFGGDHEGFETPVRAWLLLQHLDLFRTWNADASSPFHGLVDMDRVALMGHSRGGEAAAVAAAMTELAPEAMPLLRPWPVGLHVSAVVGIAPPDGQWQGAGHGPLNLAGVDYLTIQGGLDADMAWWASMRQFARTDVVSDPSSFKAAIWIRRANHGRFNTVWDLGDTGLQGAFLLDQASLLSQAEQQDVAKTVIAGFLEASLMGRTGYRSMFAIPAAGRDWLPEDVFVTRLVEGTTRMLVDFEPVATSAGVPGLQPTASGGGRLTRLELPTRNAAVTQGNMVGVELLTGDQPVDVTIAADSAATAAGRPGATLRLALGALRSDGGPLEVEVAVRDSAGVEAVVPIDAYGGTLEPIAPQAFKSAFVAQLSGMPSIPASGPETHLQTYALPMLAFVAVSPAFDSSKLASVVIRLRGPAGSAMVIDEIGVAPGG